MSRFEQRKRRRLENADVRAGYEEAYYRGARLDTLAIWFFGIATTGLLIGVGFVLGKGCWS